jgi:hypothetical protein
MADKTQSLSKGAQFDLQADNTFEVPYDGATLKFKVDATKRLVELIAVNKPSPPEKPISGGKARWTDSDLLDHISSVDACFMIPTNINNLDDVEKSLRYFNQVSKGLETGSEVKPQMLFRAEAMARMGSQANFNKTVRSTLGRSPALHAHIVSFTGAKAKK